MDLSKLSTADLQALQKGDLSTVSTEGLKALQGSSSAQPPASKAPETNIIQDVGQGVADLGAGLVAGASNVGRGVLALPKFVGLPPIGGQKFHDESAAATKEMMKDRGFLGSAGEFTAEMAGTAGIPGGKIAGMLPKALSALKGPVGAAAVEGAAAGAVLGQGDWGDVGVGAAGGAAGQKLLGGAARMISQPSKQTAQAEALRKAGIEVTAGQGSAGNSVIRSLEEAAQYVPGAANSVRTQRELPYKQIREKVTREIQPPVDALTPNSPQRAVTGDDMDSVLRETRAAMGTQYDNVVKGKTFQPDEQFDSIIADIHLSPKYTLSESDRRRVASYLSDNLNGGKKAGGWTGESLSIIRREIDKKAAQQTNPEMREALQEASEQILQMMVRQSPEVGQVHKALQAPYRNLITAEAAAKNATAQGEFGVSALARAGDDTGNPGMRDFGRLAATALKDDLNRGGTGLRTALGVGAIGTGAYLGGGTGAASTAALPAALYLGLGTRAGQKAMSGQYEKQKKLAEYLRSHPTAGATTGANLAVDAFGD